MSQYPFEDELALVNNSFAQILFIDLSFHQFSCSVHLILGYLTLVIMDVHTCRCNVKLLWRREIEVLFSLCDFLLSRYRWDWKNVFCWFVCQNEWSCWSAFLVVPLLLFVSTLVRGLLIVGIQQNGPELSIVNESAFRSMICLETD